MKITDHNTKMRLRDIIESMQVESALQEAISKHSNAAEFIQHFVNSDAPEFKGKSREDRIKMALGAFYKMRADTGQPTLDDHKTVRPKSEPEVTKEAVSEYGLHRPDEFEDGPSTTITHNGHSITLKPATRRDLDKEDVENSPAYLKNMHPSSRKLVDKHAGLKTTVGQSTLAHIKNLQNGDTTDHHIFSTPSDGKKSSMLMITSLGNSKIHDDHRAILQRALSSPQHNSEDIEEP